MALPCQSVDLLQPETMLLHLLLMLSVHLRLDAVLRFKARSKVPRLSLSCCQILTVEGKLLDYTREAKLASFDHRVLLTPLCDCIYVAKALSARPSLSLGQYHLDLPIPECFFFFLGVQDSCPFLSSKRAFSC